ncbi:MAG: hypothetical protein OEU36_11310 [Gammaproteobacteria bacterium]|nr:hypothetical protein [Gammaproteobacteria bacterium]
MANVAYQRDATSRQGLQWLNKDTLTLIVDVREEGLGAKGSNARRRYALKDLEVARISCSNPYCRNGGVPLRPIVEELFLWSETEQLRMEVCCGRMQTAHNRPALIKCHNLFRVQIMLSS